jgi:methylmalonyl-CoA mutase N-terminal domain/subunit
VLGGTQSLHTNSLDEALALPSEKAVTIALRTQQIIAHESGVANTIDPLGGSYFVEWLTNEAEKAVYEYFARIEALGGVIPALEAGFFHREIADSAYRFQQEVDSKQRIIVGVNEYVSAEPITVPLHQMDPQGERRQLERLSRLRCERDNELVSSRLEALRRAAQGKENLMPYLIDAVSAYATLGETCRVLREVFGEYKLPAMV